jgi:hypothetical protein
MILKIQTEHENCYTYFIFEFVKEYFAEIYLQNFPSESFKTILE